MKQGRWFAAVCHTTQKTINTRSNNKHIGFTFKNDSFNKSFFPVVTKLYNNLDLSLRNLPNCADFKEQLKAKYKKIKVKHYSRGISKYANTLHTQLRVGQSYLNSHGFKINLREDDLCLCHRSETVSHYFLDCFLYQEERNELLNKISQYLPRFKTFSKTKKLEIILYCFNLSKKEPDPRNLSRTFCFQNFILKTKRFSPSSPLPPYPLNLITSHLHTHSPSHSSSPAAALVIVTNFFSLWLLMEWTYFLKA